MVDPIGLEILWGRLIAIVDEAATSMERTAFSTLVRETNDYAVVLTDANGNSVVQNTVTIPVFIGTIPMTVKHALRLYPEETWQPGDVLLTNDPYLGTGHKNDITVVTPVFKGSKLIGFMGNTAHSPDVGGSLWGAGSKESFEEGLHIPPLKLYEAGRRSDALFKIIDANVRISDQVLGDIEAQVVGNEIGARRIPVLMDEMGLAELGPIAAVIQDRAEQAMRAAIRQLPKGVYEYDRLRQDGLHEQLVYKLRIEIGDGEVLADYAGTSKQQSYGVNSAMNYTYAYTAYPLKCLLSPDLPNNEGCFRPIKVTAPPGSLLNPRPPAPLAGRNMTGHCLQAAVFGALLPIMPERVLGDSGAPNFVTVLNGELPNGRRFTNISMMNGGQGAQASRDGSSATSFPANVSNTPMEILENLSPVQFLEREFVPDSGGPGERRGGLGQRIRFRVVGNQPLTLSLLLERLKTPALGLAGGQPGRLGRVWVEPERPLNAKGHNVLYPGDIITLETPGGGGFGDPARRAPDLVARDLREGYCTMWPTGN